MSDSKMTNVSGIGYLEYTQIKPDMWRCEKCQKTMLAGQFGSPFHECVATLAAGKEVSIGPDGYLYHDPVRNTPPVSDSPTLDGSAADRKALPICTGVIDYFPDALGEVAFCSKVGNDQHNPGQPLHWDKSKSADESDALVRHLMQRGTRDKDGVRHSAKVAWRALAMLQREIDAEKGR